MGCDMTDDDPGRIVDDFLHSKARHPSTPDPLAVLSEEIKLTAMSPLTVHVEFLELLEHCGGDEAKAFEILGRLKDFLQ